MFCLFKPFCSLSSLCNIYCKKCRLCVPLVYGKTQLSGHIGLLLGDFCWSRCTSVARYKLASARRTRLFEWFSVGPLPGSTTRLSRSTMLGASMMISTPTWARSDALLISRHLPGAAIGPPSQIQKPFLQAKQVVRFIELTARATLCKASCLGMLEN